jgi:hypothetical protein
MRENKEWTLSDRLADGFRAWLDENGFDYDSYNSGLYEVFEVSVNEYEEDAIDEFLTSDVYAYADVQACLDGLF